VGGQGRMLFAKIDAFKNQTFWGWMTPTKPHMDMERSESLNLAL